MSGTADGAAADDAARPSGPRPCPVCGDAATAAYATAHDIEYRSSDRAYAYRRCGACGTIFIDPPPADRLAEIYPPTYYSFRARSGASPALRIKEWLDGRLFRRLLRGLRAPTLRVLDVGGGSGWLLSVVRRADPRVAATHEVDLDESARAAAEAAGHVFHCTPIEGFASDERFDLVLMLNIIEHLANPVAVLRAVAGLLAPGGCILVKTPNTATLDQRLFRQRDWGGYHCPRHWVLFTAESFALAARRAGLEPAWIRYTQGAPQWTPSLLGLLAARGWLHVSPQRPMYTHPLFPPLLALTAALDFARLPFMRTAQMFVLLRPAPGGGAVRPAAGPRTSQGT